MTKELLFEIIVRVENTGFEVYSIVSDLAGGNVGLHGKLGITVDCSKFINPFDATRHIHVFADVPHLIKLIRNNFVDHGFLHNDSLISKAPIVELINNQKGDFRMAYKISNYHLNVSGCERMKVKPAVQLMSNSVGKALMVLGDRGELKSSN